MLISAAGAPGMSGAAVPEASHASYREIQTEGSRMVMNQPKMILFDYGGTLLCEPDWDILSGEKAILAHAVQNPRGCTPEELAAWEKAQFPSRLPVRELGVELAEIPRLRLKYELHGLRLDIPYEEAEYVLWSGASPLSERCVYPHIRETLNVIRAKGIRTGVISNLVWSGRALKRRIDALLPENHFEFVITSSDYGIRKPDVRLFQLALARAELPPEAVWYCGNDYRKDVEAARSAGIFPVFYCGHTEGDQKDRTAAPADIGDTLRITDWNELPGFLDPEG